MLHRESLLDSWTHGLSKALDNIISKRLVEKVGVSVYTPARALQALHSPGLDCVQIPSNIFDRRFEKAGIFELAERFGKIIYVRSIYLQGLALLKPEDLPAHLRFTEKPVRELGLLAKKWGLSNIELAMGFAKSAYPSCEIVFGAETVEQVQGNLRLWSREYPEGLVEAVRQCFAEVTESVCNPQLWPSPEK
jgi:aryl-alcohol dehydrogenase-like predicted oxidoreductase